MVALLDEESVLPSVAFGDEPRHVIRDFIDELSRSFVR